MASNCGCLVKAKAIPILPETAALCHQFGIDPLGVISSGALLLTLPPEAASDLMDEYANKGIQAEIIGEIAPREAGLKIEKPDGKVAPLPDFVADEITKLYK
jgi:hydrogenase maturation factor